MSDPVVSIVIPCFNRAHCVHHAIETARTQAVAHEILVIDDASTDDLADAVRHLGLPSVSYFRMDKNQGPSAARNFAARQARGEWIALLDSDDEWLPEKLETQMAYARNNDLPACSTWYVNDFAETGRRVVCRPSAPARSVDILTRGNQYGLGTTLLVRKNVFQSVGGFSEELRRMEDAEWLARYLRTRRFGVVPQVLARVAAVSVHQNKCGGQVFLDCAAAFHRHLAEEFAQLPPDVRRRYEASEFDWAAQGFFREGNWRAGLACMSRSLALRPLRSPGIVLTYLDAILGSDFTSRATALRDFFTHGRERDTMPGR